MIHLMLVTCFKITHRRCIAFEILNSLFFPFICQNAPVDVGFMVSKLLLTIQLCPKTEFQPSVRFGEDLSDSTWEYVCAIDLLCCHQKWVWTHDNIIRYGCFPDSGWTICIVKQSFQRLPSCGLNHFCF